MAVAIWIMGCAFTLEATGALGPTATAELYASSAPSTGERQRTVKHEDHTFPAADITTTTEGPAQPPPKSVSKGSDAPKVGTILGTILAWLGGLF